MSTTINQNGTFCVVELFNLQENSQSSENIPPQKFAVLTNWNFIIWIVIEAYQLTDNPST